MRVNDITGLRSGLLVAVECAGREPVGNQGQHATKWMCRCDCGNTVKVHANSLKGGKTRSCGCHRPNAGTHKASGTVTYISYCTAKARCKNPKNAKYPQYGGRGIKFRYSSFEEFMEDMGERPSGMTLDRENTNGHYEPGNCRWASQKTQQNNRTNNRVVSYRGHTKTLAQWFGKSGTKQYKRAHRLLQQGVPFSEIAKEYRL